MLRIFEAINRIGELWKKENKNRLGNEERNNFIKYFR